MAIARPRTALRLWTFVAFFVLGCLAVFSLFLGVAALFSVAAGLRSVSELDFPRAFEIERSTDYVDEQIEAGMAPDLDPLRDPLLEQRKIVLGAGINARTARDVVTKLMVLDQRDPEAPIDLFLLTNGGYADSAFAIIDAMKLITAPVNTIALGGTYSSGALILAAGTGTRSASPNSVIMIHANLSASTRAFSYGPAARQRYESLLRERCDLPRKWFPLTDDKLYYLSAEQALELGVVDEIYPKTVEASPQ